MAKNNKLHQLLAVESDLKQQAKKILVETKNTFEGKREHFDGMTRTYQHLEVDEAMTSLEIAPEEKLVVTTVDEKLEFANKVFVRTLDVLISKETTNASGVAMADLEIGGVVFPLAATALLALEGFIREIRSVYNSIPTLDPVREWSEDADRKGAFRTKELFTYRTEKKPEVIVKYDATPEHPAQTDLVMIERQVGKFHVVYKSGRYTVKRKAECLSNIDALIRETKKARSVANQAEVKNEKIGHAIFAAIHK